jgi:hypothetical protein
MDKHEHDAKEPGPVSSLVAAGCGDVDDVSPPPSDENDKICFESIAYLAKLKSFNDQRVTAPKLFPEGWMKTTVAKTSKNKSREEKFYGVLVGSRDGPLFLSEDCDHVHLPVSKSPEVLEQCRKLLFNRWKTEGAGPSSMRLLVAAGRFNEPLRLFDLSSFGLTMICCPDPRPEAWLRKGSECRINEALMVDDNTFASNLLMADCGFDLTQIRDVFGPVIISASSPRNLKLKHLRGLVKSYFGLDHKNPFGDLTDLGSSLMMQLSFPDQVDSQQRDAATLSSKAHELRMPKSLFSMYDQQLAGNAPPTDLLTHAPTKKGSFADMFMKQQHDICANCCCTGKKMKTCGRCQKVFYCSIKCQRTHWKSEHKAVCDPACA